jgi:transcriptional regulator with XRE-family HTH domain
MARLELTNEQRERLRKERKRAGLSQAELANRAGTVSQYVNMIERGKRAGASLEVLQRIATVLELEITVTISITRVRRN